METLNRSLLARLVEQPVTPSVGKVDFNTAMDLLRFTSVFDIVELPEAEFIRRLAQYNDDDGAQAYKNACSYTTQLQWLYDQQPLNAPHARSKRDLEPSAPSLLNEDWGNVCHPDAIAAIDSPVAYLRALFLFATQLEKNGRGTKTKILLSQRRPELKNLPIDHDTTFAQRPLLTLIDDMLRKQIKLHHPQEKVRALLSKQRYPLTLPYHHHHLQCRLGLSGTQHALGELNYRISKRLPFDDAGSTRYGTVKARNNDVQCLLSELNPQQQELLTQPHVTGSTLFETYFGRPSAPENLDDFLKCTALDTTQLQALLAQNSFAAHASLSASKQLLTYGARYVNGTDRLPKLEVGQSADGKTATLLNTSLDRFDRLHRMIRLQKWIDLPFAELDTLIVSTMMLEGTANADLQISHTTLRALGVYRYLRGRYRLKPLEFSAWLDRLPVQASANEPALFDQVFNRTLLSERPLPLDDQTFDSHTRQQLCAALALSDTPDSLQLLTDAFPNPLHRNLVTYSGIYRLARIAQVFGLSVLHCKQLADLLGPSTWSKLANPTLSTEMDFLDVLMRLDWAVTWLRDNDTSVTQLRQRLLLEPVADNPALKRWVDLLPKGLEACIQEFLENPAPALYSNELKRYYRLHFKKTDTEPTHLILLAPDITTLLPLPVNSTSLRQLLINPHWLDSEKSPTELVELSLGTLYLLQRFRDCCERYGLAQDSLLEYFESANSNGSQTLDTRLSQWLGWDEKELRALTETLPTHRVKSMDQLDWIMRCRQACTITRLSSQMLLDASELDTASDFNKWKLVGEAIIAARQ
ncbi:Tc toxin subunit A [Pseudomonas simiae]|uniref:Tc toxin subunit A n=1 Tax=Pseudomonas simiae TaxID=321846 RepID=UPI0016543FCE|nr:Tc toxin subunit A [Pseudomonas simiae]MBC3961864.1 insecticidal toxin complex protein [Pseudomonas simiae]UNK64791.1 Tc toxin subunit A [Pseudomonas simiae]WLG32464.1 Tc toxin subunit A [Pseudomonas simiae]WLI22461.1 Tc toxin subunit A [Pseudomonas simiae]